MTEIRRPALRYFGGKFRLAPWIISRFPAHRVYVEPFGGAASVLLRKERSHAEVYNDLDDDVVNLFHVLRDPVRAADLHLKLLLTPFARAEFDRAYAPSDDPVERARALLIRSFMGFSSDGCNPGNGKTGFRANSNRSGTTPAHDWANWPGGISALTERLSGVVIENRDALEVMAQHDSPDTLHFVDPPYVHETRGTKHVYKFEMNDAEHERLCDFLKSLAGMVVLCGYLNETYERLGWRHAKREALADGARARTEVLWLNPLAWDGHAQMSMRIEA